MKQLREHDLFIGGRAARGRGEKVITVINPATEEPIAAVPTASADDTKAAIAAAHRAFADGQGPWPAMPPRERSKILHRFCDLLEANVAELCQIARAEIGSTQMLDAVQVHWGIRQTRYWAEQAATFRFEEPLPPVLGELGGAGQSVIFKEPIGVVAAITPFNFPILLNLWKIGPALAMGNTMVLKPSPYTPLSALILARLAAEAGLPEGVLNVVVGDAEVGEILTTHPDVAMVSFTGSDTVGARIMAQAAGTIKRVVLELGGKSANIVFADVDLDNPKVMASLLSYVTHCGQGCGLPTRILAEQSIYDEVVRRMSAALAGIKVGDPADPTMMMGPLIRAAQRDRVEKYVSIGKQEGASLVQGGKRPKDLDKGFFFEPTLFASVSNKMQIAQDEIFGPVGVVIPFKDTDDAIRIANDSRYGLAGSVWSGDRARALTVTKAVRTGTISINGGNGQLGGPIGYAPFGGYKMSGLGREHGSAGAHEFLELKTVDYPIC